MGVKGLTGYVEMMLNNSENSVNFGSDKVSLHQWWCDTIQPPCSLGFGEGKRISNLLPNLNQNLPNYPENRQPNYAVAFLFTIGK
jgi:hypothetical protein